MLSIICLGESASLRKLENLTRQTGYMAGVHMNVLSQCETLDWINWMSASLPDSDSLERGRRLGQSTINLPAITGAEWRAQFDISASIVSPGLRYIFTGPAADEPLRTLLGYMMSDSEAEFDVNSQAEREIPSGLYRNKERAWLSCSVMGSYQRKILLQRAASGKY